MVPDGNKLAHQTDEGYYGKGIYTSPDPVYAKGYGHGAHKTFVCLSLPGKMFPSCYPRDLGKPLQKGYDSHYSDDNRGKKPDQEKEWVFFNSDQLLFE